MRTALKERPSGDKRINRAFDRQSDRSDGQAGLKIVDNRSSALNLRQLRKIIDQKIVGTVQQKLPAGPSLAVTRPVPFPEVQVAEPLGRHSGAEVIQGGWFSGVKRYLRKKYRAARRYARRKYEAAKRYARTQMAKAKGVIQSQIRYLPGYTFILSFLGRDPLSNKKISQKLGQALRSTLSFLGLREMLGNLKRSGVVTQAWILIKSSFAEANLNGQFILAALKNIWAGVTVNPVSWGRAVVRFKTFLGELTSKALLVGRKVLPKLPVLVFKGFLVLAGAPVEKIMSILGRMGNVIALLAKDPGQFLSRLKAFAGNLIMAAKNGFFQFAGNIKTHLKTGFFLWLSSALMNAGGIRIPEKFNLKGIFSLVMQVTGLGYKLFRSILVKLIGEQNMIRVEKGFRLIRMLMTGGIPAFWGVVKEKLGNFKAMVLSAIKNWVITRLIATGVGKLITLLAGPFGAVIEAVKTIYNFIMFFVERANQMAAVMGIVFNAVSDIAAGKIAAAANFIEKSLGLAIPLILSCLARLLQLGDLSKVVIGFIRRARERVVKVFESAAKTIARRIKGWLGRLGLSRKGEADRKDVPAPATTEISFAWRYYRAGAKRPSLDKREFTARMQGGEAWHRLPNEHWSSILSDYHRERRALKESPQLPLPEFSRRMRRAWYVGSPIKKDSFPVPHPKTVEIDKITWVATLLNKMKDNNIPIVEVPWHSPIDIGRTTTRRVGWRISGGRAGAVGIGGELFLGGNKVTKAEVDSRFGGMKDFRNSMDAGAMVPITIESILLTSHVTRVPRKIIWLKAAEQDSRAWGKIRAASESDYKPYQPPPELIFFD